MHVLCKSIFPKGYISGRACYNPKNSRKYYYYYYYYYTRIMASLPGNLDKQVPER